MYDVQRDHALPTWLVRLDNHLRIETLHASSAGSSEMPFATDLPLGVAITDAIGLPDARAAELNATLRAGGEIGSVQYVIQHELLGPRVYSLSAAPQVSGDGCTSGHQCSIVDLTGAISVASSRERHRAELDAIADASPAILAVRDLEGNLLRLNKAGRRYLGASSDPDLGSAPGIPLPADAIAFLSPGERQVLETEQPRQFEQRLSFEGKVATFLTHKFPIHDEQGCLVAVGTIAIDFTERKALESELQRIANFDDLTHLPNRRHCLRLLDQAMLVEQHREKRVGVMLLDIADFRMLNDTLGARAGDEILLETAWRLREIAPSKATLCRFGGDEFCLVIPNCEPGETFDRLLQDLGPALADPIFAGDVEHYVRLNIGAAVWPDDADGPSGLLEKADLALAHAKRESAPLRRFSSAMSQAARERTRMVSLLRHALTRNELRLVYQPIVDAETGRPVMLEALLRWQSRELGAVSPDRFISLAEDCGLIGEIGAWVLSKACADAAAWLSRSPTMPGVAVNVSPRQLFSPGFVSSVVETLARTGLPSRHLKIEITESSLIQDVGACKQILAELSGLGVTLALDDFGTGYSALSYLQQLKFDVLKLDQSFIRKAPEGQSPARLVGSVIALAHGLGMTTVAEGVENLDHWETLRSLGCDYCQGYHFSRPVPWKELDCLRNSLGNEVLAGGES
jgi:diguanylate cyclase (GGDEF)-like protein/PAS domain S-box-containing protein